MDRRKKTGSYSLIKFLKSRYIITGFFIILTLMNESLIYQTPAWLLCVILLVSMLLMVYAGQQYSKRRSSMGGIGAIEGSLFALLGLILAFTFGMSGSRYDTRRAVIVEEANAIGTAILRADLYEDTERQAFRKDFAEYLEARIDVYNAQRDDAALKAANTKAAKYSTLLWQRTARLSRVPANLVASNQMITALNQMFDVTTTRDAALRARVPDSIIILLFVLSVICSFFAGMLAPTDKKLNWLTVIGFGLLTMLVIFVILDLDRPNRGFIRGDKNVRYIVALRSMFS
jgi:hypothetical protein